MQTPYRSTRINAAIEAVNIFLQTPNGQETVRLITEQSSVTFISGQWLKLHGLSAVEPELHLETNPDGSIQIKSSAYWCGQPLPRSEQDLERFRAEHPHSWTSRGIGAETVARLISREMSQHPDLTTPNLKSLAKLGQQLTDVLPDPARKTASDQYLTQQLQSALVSLIDPDMWDLCYHIDGKTPTLVEYNTMMGMKKPFIDLVDTNPGVATWYYATWQDDQPVRGLNHPGQMVGKMRSDLILQVLSPHNWKLVANFSPEIMGAILRVGTDQEAQEMLAIVAASGVHPDANSIKFVHREILRRDIFGYPYPANEQPQAPDLTRQNYRQLAKLLLRESVRIHGINEEQQEWVNQVLYCSDWVRAISPETAHHCAPAAGPAAAGPPTNGTSARPTRGSTPGASKCSLRATAEYWPGTPW